jgi:hypothetical protein
VRYDLTAAIAPKLDYTYYASPVDPAVSPGRGFRHAQLISSGVAFSF